MLSIPILPSSKPIRGSVLALCMATWASMGCGSDSTIIGLSGELTVDPDHLVFDSVTLGTMETQDVKVINSGNGTLEISSLTIENETPSLSLTGSPALLEAGEEMIVHVTYAPVSDATVEDALIIANDYSEGGFAKVPITATPAGEVVPDIYSDPEEGEFGIIEIGTTSTITFQIGNAGFGDLEIATVELTADPEFELVSDGGLPGAILPVGGAPYEMVVQYTPEGVEFNQGFIYITSNDPDEGILEIPLNAEGGYPGGDGPLAVCSVDPEETVPFASLNWHGEDSYDTSGRPIVAHTWTVVSFPSGSSATLAGSGATRTTQTDLAGEYIAQLVVTNDLGQVSPPCEAVATVVPTENLWIEMFWTYPGEDMDLHLLKPGGALETNGDCYYGNCVGWTGLDWGTTGYDPDDPSLDLDDIPGTGPENINISEPQDGVFTVIVNDYPGSVYNGANPTTVNIYVDGSLVGSFTDDMNYGEDHYWYVATVDWPSGDVTPM